MSQSVTISSILLIVQEECLAETEQLRSELHQKEEVTLFSLVNVVYQYRIRAYYSKRLVIRPSFILTLDYPKWNMDNFKQSTI